MFLTCALFENETSRSHKHLNCTTGLHCGLIRKCNLDSSAFEEGNKKRSEQKLFKVAFYPPLLFLCGSASCSYTDVTYLGWLHVQIQICGCDPLCVLV